MGAVDIGIVLPADFDARVAGGQATSMLAYIWGESLLKDRVMLAVAMTAWVRPIAGHESPVEIATTVLGNTSSLPWEDRLLPFVVMMSIMFGGIMLPASSLVTEKQKRTLSALAVTPTTMNEIYVSKGLMAVVVSTVMGLVILALNRALGSSMGLLVGVLILGAILAAEFGVLLGMLVKDINSLFATVKSMGILLYAPALVYMFPEIPQWIARIFPTYYVIQPVIEISQHGDRAARRHGCCGYVEGAPGNDGMGARRGGCLVANRSLYRCQKVRIANAVHHRSIQSGGMGQHRVHSAIGP